MDLIEEAVAKMRAETFAKSDQLSLGDIIERCEAIAAKGKRLCDGSEPRVVFDFEYARPAYLDSWRGVYAELAIGFEFGGQIGLSEFIKMLKEADGDKFIGWKGGEFRMSRSTPVWVANRGNSGNTAVVGVADAQWQVVILTGWRNV